MKQSITVVPRKKPGPQPTGKGTPVHVRLQPDVLAGVDQFAEEHEVTRPEAMRMMIVDWMDKHQVIKGE